MITTPTAGAVENRAYLDGTAISMATDLCGEFS
jgi:hypothetical protein